MSRSILWPIIIMISALAAVIAVVVDIGSPLRAAVAFWFLLVCPGMAFVGLLRLGDRWTEWILAIALSLTLDTLTAMVMLYVGMWSSVGGITALAGQSMVGSAIQIAMAGRAVPGSAP